MSEGRRFRVIGAASGVGAQDQGCAAGPLAFHRSHAWQVMSGRAHVHWVKPCLRRRRHRPYSALPACAAGWQMLWRPHWMRGIFRWCWGDHSVAIGTWSGVARHLDTPRDYCGLTPPAISPASSYSGAVHGMPLACLLGQGDKRLLHLGIPGRQIDPDAV